jgi:radical SAM protein with 4Fe4S-binding SPASM domain
MDDSDSARLSWDNLIYIADFMEMSSERRISLLGGEPTLHPLFVEFATYLLERHFHVHVFTSGIMSVERLEEMKKFLLRYPVENLSFTCNLNHPSLSTDQETERINNFLCAFGKSTSLGVNLYKAEFDLEFLVEHINKYHLNRHIRVGLAHPIPGEINQYVAPHDLKKLAQCFVSYFDLFERFNITPGFDCGMPMCIFTDEELGRLFQLNRGNISFGCGPAIDIGPDMMVWSCFPLSGVYKKSLFDFNSMQEIGNYYRELHQKIREEAGGIFEACDSCQHRTSEVCRGGCLAHSLNHFKEEAITRFKEINL